MNFELLIVDLTILSMNTQKKKNTLHCHYNFRMATLIDQFYAKYTLQAHEHYFLNLFFILSSI